MVNPTVHQSLRYLVYSHSGIMWTSNLSYGKLAKASPKGRLLQSRSSSLEKRNQYLYFKVHLHYWEPIFTGIEIKYHKSSQNKSIAMNKKYYGNIQLADGLTNEH